MQPESVMDIVDGESAGGESGHGESEMRGTATDSTDSADSVDTSDRIGLDRVSESVSESAQPVSESEPQRSAQSTQLPPSTPTDSDSDSSYLLSDTEERLTYTPIPDTQYLTSTLAHALDSMELDKSLVLQAKLSGYLNNENQKINEKRQLVLQKLQSLKTLHQANFKPQGNARIDRLTQDIKDIELRIKNIKHGSSSLLGLFRTQTGLVNKYPVEYNQARDTVLERPWDH